MTMWLCCLQYRVGSVASLFRSEGLDEDRNHHLMFKAKSWTLAMKGEGLMCGEGKRDLVCIS